MIDGARSTIIIKAFNLCLSARKPEVSSLIITDPRHVLGLTDERLTEEL